MLTKIERPKLGIASWTLPWAIGVQGYPLPQRPLGCIGLLEKAVEAKVSVVQIADNLPLHELPDQELDQLREAATARGLVLEAGTRSLDPEHLARYIAITHRIGARILRTVLSGSLSGPKQLAAAEARNPEGFAGARAPGRDACSGEQRSIQRGGVCGDHHRIASPHVGICLDTANSLGRPETLQTVVENLAEHAVVLHAKDYDIRRIDTRMGFSVVGTAAGDGRVDFDWCSPNYEGGAAAESVSSWSTGRRLPAPSRKRFGSRKSGSREVCASCVRRCQLSFKAGTADPSATLLRISCGVWRYASELPRESRTVGLAPNWTLVCQ